MVSALRFEFSTSAVDKSARNAIFRVIHTFMHREMPLFNSFQLA